MKEKFEDRYDIIETIAGSGSIVYKALDKSFDRIVAIKTLDDRALTNQHKVEQFVQEGNLLAKFDHPNIISAYNFHEIGEFDHRCYLVCPWIESTLDQILEGENLSTAAVCDIFLKILEGVRALHNEGEGIVHRDLKPSNVFLSKDRQQVKIGDLGIASNIKSDQTLNPEALTPQYHAPEVVHQAQKIGRRADVYSLGMIFYEMLLGRARFEEAFPEIYLDQDAAAGTNMRWMNWHQDEDRAAKPLDEIAGEISSELSVIVQRMLKKLPDDRYGDVDSVINDLRNHLGSGISALPYAAIERVSEVPKLPFHKTKLFYLLLFVWFIGCSALIYFLFIKKSPLELRALEIEAAMNAMRETAIFLEVNQVDESGAYVMAENDREEGYLAKEDKKYAIAVDEFSVAKDQFEGSIKESLAQRAELVESVKRNAESLGAVESEPFLLGLDSMAVNKEFIESGDYRKSSETLNQALSHFRHALAVALEKEVGGLIVQVREIGASEGSQLFDDAVKLTTDGRLDIAEKRYANAVENLTQARTKLLELIDFSMKPRLAKLGSSSKQIDQALELCKSHVQSCQRDWYSSEVYREILLKPFTLDEYEVTNEEFLKFVVATSYVTDAEKSGYSYRVIAGKSAKIRGLTWSSNFEEVSASSDASNLPVVNVSFNDAAAYCAHVGKRLPSAAEWEYIARARESSLVFPWGNKWEPSAAVWANGNQQGPLPKNDKAIDQQSSAGHHHLVGNVWEWTSTSFDGGYLLKGGSWAEQNPANLRPAAATVFGATDSSDDFGIRCAKTQNVW